MSSVSISSSISFPLNPSLATFSYHPWIVTSFSAVAGGGSASISISTSTYARSIDFSGLVSQTDLRTTNDGFGNLRMTVFQGGVEADSYTLLDYEDGRQIIGIPAPTNADGTANFGGGEGSTITASPSSGFTVGFTLTGDGFFEYDATTAVTYFLENLSVGGISYNMRDGAPIFGGSTADSLLGFDINDATGQGYNDTLFGYAGNDVLSGLAGADTLIGGLGNDTLDGGLGDDVYIYQPGDGIDRISEGGNPILVADTQANILRLTGGITQDDIRLQFVQENGFVARLEVNFVLPDGSFDPDNQVQIRVLLSNNYDPASVDAIPAGATDLARRFSAIEFDDGSAIDLTAGFRINGSSEIVIGTADAETIFGSAVSEHFYGFDGNDRILAFRGDDRLEGGLGNDTLNGGEGNDVILGGDGADTVFGQSGDDNIDGGAGDDDLFGEGGNDTIDGGLGNDTIGGSGGNDLIDGGAGNDTAFGGEGNDDVFGGSGNDRLFGNGGNDFIDGGIGDDNLAGEGGADTLFGGDGNDVLGGGGGNDFLNGENGNDRMFGGSNEDTLVGGNGDDFMQGNQQNDDLFGQSGNDRLFGGDGGDFLDGGSGDDRLEGNQGRDTLVGGLGADVLLGGTFGDTFKFNDVAESNLVTMDLIVGVDGIGVALGDFIDVSGIDANTTTSVDDAFTFLGLQTTANALSFGAGALWLENAGGPTMLFANVDNDAVIEFAVRIDDGGAITAADYTVGDFIV